MSILLTGGTGFIGSHTAVEMINKGYDVVIVDNLYNSQASVVDRIQAITGVRPMFYEADVADKAALSKVFAENDIDKNLELIHYKCGWWFDKWRNQLGNLHNAKQRKICEKEIRSLRLAGII